MFKLIAVGVIKISFAHTYFSANYPEIIYNPKTMLWNTFINTFFSLRMESKQICLKWNVVQ